MPLDRINQNDQLGTPTPWDMMPPDFRGGIISAFKRRNRAWDLTQKEKLTPGSKSVDFKAWWKLTADSHVEDTDVSGQTIEKEQRSIFCEDEETIGAVYVGKVDDLLSSENYRTQIAERAREALADKCDKHVLQTAILTARLAARGNFPGGHQLSSPRAGATLAAAYPLSLAGSKALQDDIGEIVQKMTESDVPTDDLYGFLPPYLMRVLRQDDTLLSDDYTDRALADKINGKLLKVENVWLLETNNMPNSDLSAATKPKVQGSVAYAGDFTNVAMSILHPTAIGTVYAEGISPILDWIGIRRKWLIGASMLKGHGWNRPEAVGVIEFDNS